ncbi:hypothetical protein LVO79_21100 (plasmid) [Roseivivax marinus]|uniref:hypothetical protein n=1 Tax=Roseivivax marinus TaxID=1379903 RepID=UPI001F045DBC|nr:hypothetical protein [Roseivivax marinus]UMA67279.1 hypothetical protein LVO79_21100 [Roseivivax marinus]
MSRHDRRTAKAKARKQCPDLDMRPGRIAVPIPGTMDWGPDGKSCGVWGQDKPCRYVQINDDGSARPLTDAEMQFAIRNYGQPN